MSMLLAEAEYPQTPLDLQMQIGWLVLICLTLLVVWAWTRADSLRRAFFAREDPRLFALFRIGLGLITIQNFWNLNMHWRMLWTDEGMFTADETLKRIGRSSLAGWSELDGFFDHWALVKFFWGKYSLLYIDSSPSFVIGYLVVLYVVLVLFTIGFRTRITAVIGMLLVNSLYNRNAVYLEGHDTVFRCMWFMVLFARTDAAWSVDNWLRRKRERWLHKHTPGGDGGGEEPSRDGQRRRSPQTVPYDWWHFLDRAGHWLYGGLWAWWLCAIVDFDTWSTNLVVAAGLTISAIVGIVEHDDRRKALAAGRAVEEVLGPQVRFQLIPAWPRYLFIAQLICLYMATGLYKTGGVWSHGDALYYALNMDHFYRFEGVTQWVSVYLATNVFRVFTLVTLYWEKAFGLVAIGLILRWRHMHRDAPWYKAMEAKWWRIWPGRLALAGAYLVLYRIVVLAYPWCLELDKDKQPTPPEPGLQVIHIVFSVVLPLLLAVWIVAGRLPIRFGKRVTFDQEFIRKWVFGRRIWLGIGCLFHGMLIATMNIGMFPVIMMWFYPTFFEAKPFLIAGRWLATRWRRRRWTRWLAPKLLDEALSEERGVLETAEQAMRRDPTGPWWLDPWRWLVGLRLLGLTLVRKLLRREPLGPVTPAMLGSSRGGRIPDAAVLLIIASAVSLATWRGFMADEQGSSRGTTASFVGDVRAMESHEQHRAAAEARKKTLELIGDAGHWWAYAGLALAFACHFRRRAPEDLVESAPAAESTIQTEPTTEPTTEPPRLAEPPMLGGTVMRTLALGFFIFHCGAIGTTFIPRYPITAAWRTEATKVFGHYVSGTNLSQSWKMFAPNPPRGNTFMRTIVIDTDEGAYHVGKDHYINRPYVFWYNDRERKMHRRMIGKSKWYLRYWGDYHCRDWAFNNDGHLPKEVRMFKLRTPIPPPDQLAESGVPSNPRKRRLQSELVETHACRPDVITPEMKLRRGWPLTEEDQAKLDADAKQAELTAEAKRKQWAARKDFGGKGTAARPAVGTVQGTVEPQDD